MGDERPAQTRTSDGDPITAGLLMLLPSRYTPPAYSTASCSSTHALEFLSTAWRTLPRNELILWNAPLAKQPLREYEENAVQQ
ncbi:hypothetical protein O181_041548 [Austropuccinia psidii MF-1]|uniref:Uncharacterized protein n=1 Tax=Austropuccinia psidii MF-1 TaxID=1389203 RepID=A0A9Q3HDW6_9BASI|nr:hypothetical protein [Austropuccinia psidii MF-1]